MQSRLNTKAIESTTNPTAFLDIASVFGKLKDSTIFVDAYTKAYNAILKHGVEQCVNTINANL
jgi:mannitol 2-dehydrogenase